MRQVKIVSGHHMGCRPAHRTGSGDGAGDWRSSRPACLRQPHQLAHVDDPVETGAQQVLFRALTSLAWFGHDLPRRSITNQPSESRFRNKRNSKIKLQGKQLQHQSSCNSKPDNAEIHRCPKSIDECQWGADSSRPTHQSYILSLR